VHELSHYLGEGTNNIAELTAIRVAARLLAGSARPVRIHTDSQYAIGVLTKGWKAKANRALVAQVKEALSQLPRVQLIYVPAHAGVPLNERADELAVAATAARASGGWT
jgi:ribonuclease HI